MQIAIIGCGPAGLCAAIALHDSQFDVTIYEQFDKPRPIGSGLMLQPTGLAVLEALGLRSRTEALGQRIDGMLGRLAPNGKVVLDIQYRALKRSLYGVAIHRATLFQVLFDAVKERDIEVVTSQRITSIDQSNPRCITIEHQEFDIVIDASGANSAILQSSRPGLRRKDLSFGALWTTVPLGGFESSVLEQRYVKAHTMLGVLPCGRLPHTAEPLATLFYSLESKDYRAWQQAGLGAWQQQVIRLWPQTEPLLQHITTEQDLTFAQYHHHTLSPPSLGRLLFIGDAAHATSPQLGQGANMAFLDALAVTIALKTHPADMRAASRCYARMRRTHVSLYQSVSYLLTPFYQSHSAMLPWLRDTLFEPVTAIQLMQRLVTRLGAGMLADPSDRLTTAYLQPPAQDRANR